MVKSTNGFWLVEGHRSAGLKEIFGPRMYPKMYTTLQIKVLGFDFVHASTIVNGRKPSGMTVAELYTSLFALSTTDT